MAKNFTQFDEITTLDSDDLILAWDTSTGSNKKIQGLGSWATFTPTYTGGGSMTYTSVTTNHARYLQSGSTVFFSVRATGTTGGTASQYIVIDVGSLPVTPATNQELHAFSAYVNDTTYQLGFGRYDTGIGISVFKGSGNFALGASKQIVVAGFYEI